MAATSLLVEEQLQKDVWNTCCTIYLQEPLLLNFPVSSVKLYANKANFNPCKDWPAKIPNMNFCFERKCSFMKKCQESIPCGIKWNSTWKVNCSSAVGGKFPDALRLWKLPYFNCKAQERKIKDLISSPKEIFFSLVRSSGPRVPNWLRFHNQIM